MLEELFLINISVGGYKFTAIWEKDLSPKTCAAFKSILPFENKIIQARWSGEAAWIPMGNFDLGVSFENPTSFPSKGNILFYPSGLSETEILFVYGYSSFASKAGTLAGNHFISITEGLEKLSELGEKILWEGAQPILFELCKS